MRCISQPPDIELISQNADDVAHICLAANHKATIIDEDRVFAEPFGYVDAVTCAI